MSSECFLSDQVFSKVIVNESLVICGSNNVNKVSTNFHNVTFHTLDLHFDLLLLHSGVTFRREPCY